MISILAYDLGTGGTKASLFDAEGNMLASTFVSCQTFYPHDQFHEQRPDDWWQSIVQSTRDLLNNADFNAQDIACLAVSGHSLGVVPVDDAGLLLVEKTPIWSDSRAREQAKRFFSVIDEDNWYMATGNGFPAALYGIFKIMWLREHCPEVYNKAACFLGTKDYVNLRMTGVAVTDHSYASGSGVYSLKERRYVEAYVVASGIQVDKLPRIVESSHIIGTLTAQAAADLGLPRTVRVASGGVDNACMALGAGCTRDGDAYTSLGSSAWIAVSSHEPVVNAHKRPYVFAHCIPGMYTSATSIFSAGNTFHWLKNTLFAHLEREAALQGQDVYDLLTGLAAVSPPGSNKLICNPSLAGGSGLDKSNNVRGCYTGLTLSHTANDMIRATLEGVCLNLRIAMDVLDHYVPLSKDMLIVGGGGKSQFWRTLFADIYCKNIIETNIGQEAGSLGAAAVAAVGAGLWDTFDNVKSIHIIRGKIEPDESNSAIYERIRPVFQKICDVQSDIGDWLGKLEI